MPNALLVIAPRKPERFDEVERLARARGLARSRAAPSCAIDAEPRADVVVLDTIGELAQLYQVATAVFVGGSLVDAGGHNILEPAVFGKPIVFGPHMQNFAEIAQTFLDNGAAIQVRDGARARAGRCSRLLGDPVRRARLGAAARALVEANRGARGKTLAVIAELLPLAGESPSGVVPAASAWCTDGRSPAAATAVLRRPRARRRRERYARRPDLRRRLRAAGRSASATSPSAAAARRRSVACARATAARGRRAPGDPQRGYARTQPDDGVVVVSDPDGIRADLARAGDEPLMLARQLPGVAGLVVARSLPRRPPRRASASASTVHVLDDGFQHLQLDRDVDLVIVGSEDLDLERPDAAGRPAARTAGRAGRRGRGAGGRPAASDLPEVSTGRCSRCNAGSGDRRDGPVVGIEVRRARCAGGRAWPASRDPERFLERPARHAGWTSCRMRWSSGIIIRIHADDVERICRRRRVGGRARRRDDREGLRPAAAVPAVSAAGRVPAAYNGDLSRRPSSGGWLDASLRAARDITVD